LADPDDLLAKVGAAKSKFALERLEDANAMLQKLRQSNPESMLVLYWLGRVEQARGHREGAEQAYRAAIQLGNLHPSVVDAYVGLAALLNQQDRSEEARATLSDARDKLPDSPAIHKALGELALTQGRYQQAFDEYQQALNLDPKDIGTKFQLGVVLRRDRKFDLAGKVFDEVAQVDRDLPGLALERGLLYEQSGRTEEALKAYEAALAKAPNDLDLMLKVGCGKVSSGRGKEAADLLRKVLLERADSAETNHCLGRALLVEGKNLAEAERMLERAVELDVNHPEYYLYVGWAANEAGHVAKADKALGKAIELDRGLADAYWQRGVLRARQGAVRDAVSDFKKALELRPTRFEAHATLADAYYDLGMEDQAMLEWEQAVTADGENATWQFRYGRLLVANRRDEAGRSHLSKAIELGQTAEPRPAWLWEAHHMLARALGKRPEAITHWEQFLRLGPHDSPYRAEAIAALKRLGRPWSGD
jgi:tetratricopeptide (TPR) repeat protein